MGSSPRRGPRQSVVTRWQEGADPREPPAHILRGQRAVETEAGQELPPQWLSLGDRHYRQKVTACWSSGASSLPGHRPVLPKNPVPDASGCKPPPLAPWEQLPALGLSQTARLPRGPWVPAPFPPGPPAQPPGAGGGWRRRRKRPHRCPPSPRSTSSVSSAGICLVRPGEGGGGVSRLQNA